jgi:hypothetical protein
LPEFDKDDTKKLALFGWPTSHAVRYTQGLI